MGKQRINQHSIYSGEFEKIIGARQIKPLFPPGDGTGISYPQHLGDLLLLEAVHLSVLTKMVRRDAFFKIPHCIF